MQADAPRQPGAASTMGQLCIQAEEHPIRKTISEHECARLGMNAEAP